MNIITYFYRGGVERGTGTGYEWRNGYSESGPRGEILYPWMITRVWQAEAKKRGAVAKFEDRKPDMNPKP